MAARSSTPAPTRNAPGGDERGGAGTFLADCRAQGIPVISADAIASIDEWYRVAKVKPVEPRR